MYQVWYIGKQKIKIWDKTILGTKKVKQGWNSDAQ